jgi:hypothetical protein
VPLPGPALFPPFSCAESPILACYLSTRIGDTTLSSTLPWVDERDGARGNAGAWPVFGAGTALGGWSHSTRVRSWGIAGHGMVCMGMRSGSGVEKQDGLYMREMMGFVLSLFLLRDGYWL